MSEPWQALLAFWFGELDEGIANDQHKQRWFEVNPEFDELCRTYAPLLDQARDGALASWTTTPQGTLAFVLVCDQLPRNLFRGRADAYAWDPLALNAARASIRQRQDRELGWDERCFLYMPFEHSEDLIDQHTSVGLFTQLRDESPSHLRSRMGNSLRFAHQHRSVIERFGRFPHRNAVLGRRSSEAEESFVARGDGFGQQPRKEQA